MAMMVSDRAKKQAPEEDKTFLFSSTTVLNEHFHRTCCNPYTDARTHPGPRCFQVGGPLNPRYGAPYHQADDERVDANRADHDPFELLRHVLPETDGIQNQNDAQLPLEVVEAKGCDVHDVADPEQGNAQKKVIFLEYLLLHDGGQKGNSCHRNSSQIIRFLDRMFCVYLINRTILFTKQTSPAAQNASPKKMNTEYFHP